MTRGEAELTWPEDLGELLDGIPEPVSDRVLLDPGYCDHLARVSDALSDGFGGLAAEVRERLWRLARLLDDADEQQRRRLLIPELAPIDVLRGACVWKKNQGLAATYRATPGYQGEPYLFTVAGGSEEHVQSGVLVDRAMSTSYPVRSVAGLRAHSAMMEKENVPLFASDVTKVLGRRAGEERPDRGPCGRPGEGIP